MRGMIRYDTEREGEGLVMVDEVSHIIRSGDPPVTRIFLKDGGVLESTTELDILQEAINRMSMQVTIEQAKACHFGIHEMDPR